MPQAISNCTSEFHIFLPLKACISHFTLCALVLAVTVIR